MDERRRRLRIFEEYEAALAKLQEDPEAWGEYQAELRLWETTLMDGLPENEIWDPETRTARIVERERTE